MDARAENSNAGEGRQAVVMAKRHFGPPAQSSIQARCARRQGRPNLTLEYWKPRSDRLGVSLEIEQSQVGFLIVYFD